jgi:signal transduction histidine kinase
VTQDSPERFSVRLSLLQLEGSALQLESPKQLRVCSHNKSGETHRSLRMSLAIYRTLHPFTLEYLGLARALKKLCRDTGAKSGLTINFSGKDVPPHIPSDISRCLFRVAQEALQNIVKHNHARPVFMELKVRGGHALPRIVHDGVGITPEQSHGGAMGLTTMRERADVLDGTCEVTSGPLKGTTVEATAPLREA